ncbi:MAG: hypothetical protein MZW92_18565 [Comamonadaceae bacterium]|nr:hypothetical protein [Comamonadaceae bacterium]
MVSAPVLLVVLVVGLVVSMLPGRHADQRGHAELRAQDRRRGRGARLRRAVDADDAGRVPAAHAAVDSHGRRLNAAIQPATAP